MTTDTMTTARDALRLVRISDEEYIAGPSAWPSTTDLPGGEGRVFFARAGIPGNRSEMTGDGWAVLVLPESDPRSEGMWPLRSEYAPGGAEGFRGWNIETRYLTDVEQDTTPEQEDDTPESRLVPGVWFTWGSRTVWYRVARVESDRVRTDRRCYMESSIESGEDSHQLALARRDSFYATSDPTDPALPQAIRDELASRQTERRALRVGDRVRQSGPHYIANDQRGREFHEYPHGIGSLATVEDIVTHYGAGNAVRVRWDGGGTSVIATDSLELVERDDDSTPDESPAATFTQADLDRARAEGRQEAEQEFDRWKESATETAHQYAADNGLCSQFDRCMVDIGLRPRTREQTFRVTVTRTVTVDAPYGGAPDREVLMEAFTDADLTSGSYCDVTVENYGTEEEVDSW